MDTLNHGESLGLMYLRVEKSPMMSPSYLTFLHILYCFVRTSQVEKRCRQLSDNGHAQLNSIR
jgi:hypothetical protein